MYSFILHTKIKISLRVLNEIPILAYSNSQIVHGHLQQISIEYILSSEVVEYIHLFLQLVLLYTLGFSILYPYGDGCKILGLT